jgi:hypothetical protein
LKADVGEDQLIKRPPRWSLSMTSLFLLAACTLAPSQAPTAPVTADDFRPDPGWKSLGPSVWFDAKGKRLVVRGRVALVDGFLEHLLCLERTKEHESVLATDAPAKAIHAGLLLTGAAAGHPVRFEPKFEPPAGTSITIDLEWKNGDGQVQRANAREWIRDQKTSQALDIDWVFAGSNLFVHPDTGKTVYAADGGDLITVSNFTSAILDLPIASSADDSARAFVANTPRIPRRGTRVTLYLHPATAERKPAPKP